MLHEDTERFVLKKKRCLEMGGESSEVDYENEKTFQLDSDSYISIGEFCNVQRKPEKCPDCGSKNIVDCPGGTCIKLTEGICWICQNCLNEFGPKQIKKMQAEKQKEQMADTWVMFFSFLLLFEIMSFIQGFFYRLSVDSYFALSQMFWLVCIIWTIQFLYCRVKKISFEQLMQQ